MIPALREAEARLYRRFPDPEIIGGPEIAFSVKRRPPGGWERKPSTVERHAEDCPRATGGDTCMCRPTYEFHGRVFESRAQMISYRQANGVVAGEPREGVLDETLADVDSLPSDARTHVKGFEKVAGVVLPEVGPKVYYGPPVRGTDHLNATSAHSRAREAATGYGVLDGLDRLARSRQALEQQPVEYESAPAPATVDDDLRAILSTMSFGEARPSRAIKAELTERGWTKTQIRRVRERLQASDEIRVLGRRWARATSNGAVSLTPARD